MITAGVQQALQTLEISGAAPSASAEAPVQGEDFRSAFAANVGGGVAGSGGGQAAGNGAAPVTAQSQQAAQNGIEKGVRPSGQAAGIVQAAKSLPKAADPLALSTLNSTFSSTISLKSNSALLLAGKEPVSLPDGSTATTTAASSRVKADSTLDATGVPISGAVEAGGQIVSTDEAWAQLALRDGIDVAGLAGRAHSLPTPVPAETAESGLSVEGAGTRSRKGEVTSSTKDAAAGAPQAASPFHTPADLTTAATQASVGSITLSAGASENSQSLSGAAARSTGAAATGSLRGISTTASNASPTSAPARSASGAGTLAAAGEANKFIDGTRSAVTDAASGLAGGVAASTELTAKATRADGAVAEVSSADVTRFSGANADLASAEAGKPDTLTGRARAGTLRSEAVSEPIAAGNVAPSTSLSSALAGSNSGTSVLPVEALSTKSGSANGISGSAANQPEAASKISGARGGQSGVQTGIRAGSGLPGGASGAGLSGNKTIAVDGEGGSADQSAAIAGDASRVAEGRATGPLVGVTSPAPGASQLPRPAETPERTSAASQTAAAAGKDRTVKGRSDDSDSASAVAQPDSGKDSLTSATAVPAIAGDAVREAAASIAPAVAGGVSAVAAHTAVTAVAPLASGAVAVHTAGSPTSTLTGTSGVRAEGRLDEASAQSTAFAQSGDSHRTLLATPTALEVGMQSGTQGWLKIRAEAGGPGEVKASLDAASASGRELLHSQLPALNAFLHSEQMPVTASVAQRSAVTDTGAAGTALGSSGFDGGSHGALLQHGGQQESQQDSGRQLNLGTSGTVKSYDMRVGVSDSLEASSAPLAEAPGENGRWLNVRV